MAAPRGYMLAKSNVYTAKRGGTGDQWIPDAASGVDQTRANGALQQVLKESRVIENDKSNEGNMKKRTEKRENLKACC